MQHTVQKLCQTRNPKQHSVDIRSFESHCCCRLLQDCRLIAVESRIVTVAWRLVAGDHEMPFFVPIMWVDQEVMDCLNSSRFWRGRDFGDLE